MNKSKIVKDFFEEVYNRQNINYILDFFSDDYYEHTENGARNNKDAVNIVRIALNVFPDIKVKVNDIVESGNTVAIRATFSGTHSDDFIGLKPTNKFIEWEAMEFFIIEDDIITESYGAWPLWEMHKQLTNMN